MMNTMSPVETSRLFFAFGLPEEAREAATEFVHAHRGLSLRWTPPENLHATVLFLGSVAREKLRDVQAIAQRVVADAQLSPLRITAIDWGPPGTTPRMIWFFGEANEEWNAIKMALRNGLSAIGVYRGTDERSFSLHVTLARMEPRPKSSLPDIRTPFSCEWMPRELWLMESRLSPKGAAYSVVERFAFRG